MRCCCGSPGHRDLVVKLNARARARRSATIRRLLFMSWWSNLRYGPEILSAYRSQLTAVACSPAPELGARVEHWTMVDERGDTFTEGLPPPCDPHPGYATVEEAIIAHRRWLREQFPPSAPAARTPVALARPAARTVRQSHTSSRDARAGNRSLAMLARTSFPRDLQDRPNRARRLRDVGEQFGQRIGHRQRFAAAFLGGQHIVDERAAMQNALLLAPERVDLSERPGASGRRCAGRGCRGAVAVSAVGGGATRVQGSCRHVARRRDAFTRATWCPSKAASWSQASRPARTVHIGWLRRPQRAGGCGRN